MKTLIYDSYSAFKHREDQDKAIKLIVEARGGGESESDMVRLALDDFIYGYEDSGLCLPGSEG